MAKDLNAEWEALLFLTEHHAQAINVYSDPTVKIITYKLDDGSIWVERCSRLESPYDDYSFKEQEGEA